MIAMQVNDAPMVEAFNRMKEIEAMTYDQIDFVRLSQGTTRAHAIGIIEGGYKLPEDWPEQLKALREAAAKAKANEKAAERTTKDQRKAARKKEAKS